MSVDFADADPQLLERNDQGVSPARQRSLYAWSVYGGVLFALVAITVVLSGCSVSHDRQEVASEKVSICPRMTELGQVNPGGTGRVVGEVYSSARLPMNQALIEVLDATGTFIRGEVTNPEGVFRVDSVAPGQVSVRVRSIGHDTQIHHVTVVTVAPTVVCAVMQETRIPLSH